MCTFDGTVCYGMCTLYADALSPSSTGLALVYRVAAIFPEHFQSFIVALQNHTFY
jgi:hypothetical protein